MKTIAILSAFFCSISSFAGNDRDARECLGNLRESQPKTSLAKTKWSNITGQMGYQSLAHVTDVRNVVEIIESGHLALPKNLPEEKIAYGQTPHLVMFYLEKSGTALPTHPAAFSRGFARASFLENAVLSDAGRARLYFSLRSMNGRDFHMHQGAFGYGEFHQGIDFRSTDPSSPSLETFLKQNSVTEVGFYQDVPVKFLERVWVLDPIRKEVLAQLHAKGITHIRSRPLEEIIQSPSSEQLIIRPISEVLEASENEKKYYQYLIYENSDFKAAQ